VKRVFFGDLILCGNSSGLNHSSRKDRRFNRTVGLSQPAQVAPKDNAPKDNTESAASQEMKQQVKLTSVDKLIIL
jgi:hypothetical protein